MGEGVPGVRKKRGLVGRGENAFSPNHVAG
jgi:hypothetical protein